MFARGLLLPVAVVALVLAAGAARGEESAAQKVYDKVWPFIVVVRATDSKGNEAHGSGVIIGDNEVATNCHVVADANRISVLRATNKGGAADGETIAAAKVSRGDYGRDICLLSVPDLPNAKAAAIRKAKTLKVGEAVFAVGSPQGLDYSISAGIISQLRSLAGTPPLIQTDAAISKGSSGGGLFDADGNLVGLTTFYNREGQNLNFAVPTEWIADIRKKPAGEIAGADEKVDAGAGLDYLDGAIELERAKDWQKMLTHCRRWTEAESNNAAAWYVLGVAYGNLGRYDEAIAAYREALRIDPEFAFAWNNLGIAYGKLDRNDDEIAAFREALRIAPEDAVTWYNLGNAYGKLGRNDDAIAAYRKALRIAPEDAFTWNNLGITYDKLGRNDDAIVAFREVLRIDPEYTFVWNNLGNAYNNLGHHDEAIAAYREALRIDLEDAFAWNNLGNAYNNLGRHDEAIAAFRKALRIDPEDADVWYNLGNVYGKLGRHDEAIAAFREALRIDPEYADAWNSLGTVYSILGRRDEAIAALHKGVRINPENVLAWKILSIIYRTQGRNIEADEAHQKHLRLKVISGE